MSNLQIFESPEWGPVRTVELDGAPWLVGKDVATALGYSNTRDALDRHVDPEDKNTVVNPDGNRGNPNMTIINESGLYSLVLASKLPSARRFRRWVTSVVLPSIRSTGGYIAGQEQLSDAELMAQALMVAQRTIESRDARIRELGDQNTALLAENEQQRQVIADFEPVRQYVDTILQSTGTLATSQIAADYGLSAQQLNNILREAGIQHKVNGQWLLYKKYMGLGYTKSKTINITHSDGRPDTKMQTYWTQKGRLMIHNILTARGIQAVMDREKEA